MSSYHCYGNRQPPKILVIEDNVAIQEGTKGILNKLKCDVDIVGDGYSALGKNILDYDLILLDIGLPDISGIDVCKKIKSQYPHCATPIIAYTAFGKVMEQPCHDAGINECVIKPLSQKGFASLLKRYLNWEV